MGTTPQLVLATHNAGKVAELRRLLAAANLGLTVLGAGDFAALPDVAETGSTFAANALLKARAVADYSGLPAVADDSGLCVDALNGMPGILSARWAGRHGDDDANLDLLLGQLADVADERRGAHFLCAAAIALPGQAGRPGVSRVVEGIVEGTLLRSRRGTNGFGYDPIFLPYGHARTTAEFSAEEKDAISHRGQALRALLPIIEELVVPGSTARRA
ncbi:MAG: RdgB/HAM1 family non-canonical purine NTP pyrophosphatase [Candidatus Nanopelagicales bacterium]